MRLAFLQHRARRLVLEPFPWGNRHLQENRLGCCAYAVDNVLSDLGLVRKVLQLLSKRFGTRTRWAFARMAAKGQYSRTSPCHRSTTERC